MLKEGERTPILITDLKLLRARIKDIEYQEVWEAKVEEATEKGNLRKASNHGTEAPPALTTCGWCDFGYPGNISESKLDQLLQEGVQLIVQDCEELVHLKDISTRLLQWIDQVCPNYHPNARTC